MKYTNNESSENCSFIIYVYHDCLAKLYNHVDSSFIVHAYVSGDDKKLSFCHTKLDLRLLARFSFV